MTSELLLFYEPTAGSLGTSPNAPVFERSDDLVTTLVNVLHGKPAT